MVTALAFVAAGWGIAMAVSPVLQIRKIVQHRSSHGVSLGYMTVLFVGFLLWLSYGIALGNWALIVPNVVAAVVITATMAVTLRFRRPSAPASGSWRGARLLGARLRRRPAPPAGRRSRPGPLAAAVAALAESEPGGAALAARLAAAD